MCNTLQSCDQVFDVNCQPQSEVIVSGTPKWVIQEKIKAREHAAADVSEGRDCFHPLGCVINDHENVVATVL
jgi:hypothetical protein